MPQRRIDRIVEALQAPLPGDEAKACMLPPRRSLSRPHDNYRAAAVLILLFPEEGEVRFPLMVRREVAGDVHSGQISLPGGSQVPDEDLVTTALREANEELGIDPSLVEVVGSLTLHRIPISGFDVLPVVGVASRRPPMVPDPVEVGRILVTSVEALEEPSRRTEFEGVFSGETVRIPAWRIEGGLLWGATAMILSELLAICANVDSR